MGAPAVLPSMAMNPADPARRATQLEAALDRIRIDPIFEQDAQPALAGMPCRGTA